MQTRRKILLREGENMQYAAEEERSSAAESAPLRRRRRLKRRSFGNERGKEVYGGSD